MTLPPPEIWQRIRNLHAMMGSPNAHESATAFDKLKKLLPEHGLTWNDLSILLDTDISLGDVDSNTSNGTAGSHAPTDAPEVNVLDLILFLIERHVAVTSEERIAVALWVLHTYVFDRFDITPRLAVLSPASVCGKTRLMVLMKLLVKKPNYSDNVTPAVIYRELELRPGTTFLLDEADNQGLLNDHVLRSVFNSGHGREGSIDRIVDGQPKKFRTFAPLAVAAIGTLPLPLLSRAAAVINMRRYAAGEMQIHQLDIFDASFPAAREEVKKWAAACSLGRDPATPFHNRAADNWRVLLSIADDLGHGEEARSAAIKLCANRRDEDPSVALLADIRTVFLARGMDRITSSALVEALVELDDGFWNEWGGPQDDRSPHKLTQGELARILKRFQIKPSTVWRLHRQPSDKSSRGYHKHQFEAAWRSYCRGDTPTQSGRIRYLRQS
jgi:Protein of unknown function (DUF3631)